jgi:peptidyl-prolyl cis-trans isomerase SurA
MRFLTVLMPLAVCLCGLPAQAQPLFTYGGKPVSKTEFLNAFNKNPAEGNREQALQAYLPLYINYKLKVQDAYDRKMDTLPNQVAEAQNYRQQAIENFLNTQSGADGLVKEAFEYSQTDVLIAHLFIAADAGNPIAASNAAQMAAKADAALQGGMSFDEALKQFGTEPDRLSRGVQTSWITAFTLPYRYEKPIYAATMGGYTAPIKGPTGWHIFKKIQERPAVGKVKLAQILLLPLDKSKPDDTKATADSVCQLLQNGADFESLARSLSADRSSLNNGGNLPPFGVGAYDPKFEAAAFGLSKPGQLTPPFETGFGWHILKLIEKQPVVSDSSDADNLATLRQKVLETGRTEGARRNYISSQMPAMAYKLSPTLNYAALWQYTDSTLKNKSVAGLPTKASTPIFGFYKKTYTASDFANYAKSLADNGKTPTNYPETFDAFVAVAAENEWRNNALRLNPALKAQVQEFTDANLLFESMDKQVWSKASEDQKGLEAYYKTQPGKYTWGESINAIIITADAVQMKLVQDSIKASPANWRFSVETTNPTGMLMIDSGRYELNQLPDLTLGGVQNGQFTASITNAADSSQTCAYIVGRVPAGGQRSFEEARGFVVNDYQQVLEQQWIDRLRKRYPVVVNQQVLKGL